jgi:hypothetical protein
LFSSNALETGLKQIIALAAIPGQEIDRPACAQLECRSGAKPPQLREQASARVMGILTRGFSGNGIVLLSLMLGQWCRPDMG